MNCMVWKERQLERIRRKMGGGITNLTDITGGAEPSPLFYLLADRMAYLMSGDPERVLSERKVRLRRRMNGFLKLIGPLFLQQRQVFESRNTLLGIDQPDKSFILPEEPVIWCANHAFKDDILATVLACRHAYIFFGSLPVYFNTFDGVSAFINGVIMCNRKMAVSRRASTENAKRVLAMGADLLLFPEGVWNKTPERLLLDFWPGIYRMAKDTGSKIVPVIHYLAEPHKKYKDNVIHTVVADPVSMEGLSEVEGLKLLRDTMATWYYRLMERYGRFTRQEVLAGHSSSDDAWESYISVHTGAIKYYDREIELSEDFRPRDIVRPEDVWRPVAAIREWTPEKAGHICYARRMVEQEERRDFQRRY